MIGLLKLSRVALGVLRFKSVDWVLRYLGEALSCLTFELSGEGRDGCRDF